MCLTLFGCASGAEYGDYAQSIDSSNNSGQNILVAYFSKKAVDNQNIFRALGANTDDPKEAANNQMAIVLYTLLSQQNDEKVLRYFVPKYADKPTTNADIGKSLADNFLPTLVKWGAGAWLGGEIVDGLAAGTVLTGGSTLINQRAGNDITGSITNSPSITETTSYNTASDITGDNSQGNEPTQTKTEVPETLEEEALPSE